MSTSDDREHMRSALALARRGLGNTWPNPSVGCVVVRDGRVVGRALTAPAGRPHAETQALAMAGEAARGATVYVTLEPCCHWGRTPPCTDALIAAGVARVVIGARDTDPRVDGEGMSLLRQAGVAVEDGVFVAESGEVTAGFAMKVRLGRPLVTLKLASTLDGRIATGTGESQWITGVPARRMAHALRGRHDAVMVGVGTVLADDPDLTCRVPGYKPVPVVRVIADSHIRTPLTARIVGTAGSTPTWIACDAGAEAGRRRAMTAAGVAIIEVGANEVGLNLPEMLAAVAARGITTLLVEGGAKIAAALLRADLVDRLAWFHAPTVIGGDGWPAAQAFGVATLAEAPRFQRASSRLVGVDMFTEFTRAA